MAVPDLPQTNEEAWAIAHAWGTAREMNEVEALMWRAESDPRLRSTMLGLYVLDCEPDWERLLAAHQWGSRLLPRFRQRVVDPPLHVGLPAWAADGSLNDAFIAALLGGFRRYHEHHNSELNDLPLAMPISLHRGDHPMGGNRFAGARFAAPAGEPDPAERIRLIHDFVLTARAEPALDALRLLAPAINRLPTPLVTCWCRAQTTKLDLQASNIAGIPYTVYMAGARIERLFPFGPLPGCAVMATLVSHDGTCCIGINCDPAAVTRSCSSTASKAG